MGRPRKPLVVSSSETLQLQSMARSPRLSHSLARRALIVLMSTEGASYQAIASHCGVSVPTVNLWRQRWREGGIASLHGKHRPGRPPAYSHKEALALMHRVLQNHPGAARRWTVRSVAAQTGLSKSTIARYFAMFRLKPHLNQRARAFPDTRIVENSSVVGLYIYPPDKTLILCANEAAQIQAQRVGPAEPPMLLERAEGVTTSSGKKGASVLRTALNTLERPRLRRWHRSPDQEYLAFLDRLDRIVPTKFDLQLIADKGTREYPKLKAWLAGHPRYHLYYAPTHSKWLDLLESWLSRTTLPNAQRRWIRNLPAPVPRIDAYIEHCDTHRQPFGWIASANSILRNFRPPLESKVTNGTVHS